MTVRSVAGNFLRTYGRAVAGPVLVNASSQAGGLLQYVLLIIWTHIGDTSDFYFLLLAWTSIPMQLILTGVCYPLLLRGAEVSARRWMNLSLILVPLSSIPVLGIFLSRLRNVDSVWMLTVSTVLYSMCVLLATYDGFREAVRGNALILSAATVFGSVGAVVGLFLYKFTAAGNGVLLMCVGSLVGEALFLVGRRARRFAEFGAHAPGAAGGRRPKGVVSTRKESDRRASSWYLGKSVAGYGGGLTLQSYSSSLAPAFLSYFSISQRVVGGFAGVFSNSVLPFLVHGETEHPREAERVTVAAAGAVALVAVMVSGGVVVAGSAQFAGLTLLLGGWLSASLYAAGMQRLAYRLLPASAAGAPIATSIGVVAVGSVTLLSGDFSPVILLLSVIFLDGISAVFFGFRLSLRRSAVAVCTWTLLISIPGAVLLGRGSF